MLPGVQHDTMTTKVSKVNEYSSAHGTTVEYITQMLSIGREGQKVFKIVGFCSR